MTLETLDQIKLAQHRLIAKKLQENPEPIIPLAGVPKRKGNLTHHHFFAPWRFPVR